MHHAQCSLSQHTLNPAPTPSPACPMQTPGIIGVVEVAREAYPDHFAFDKSSKYYDARSTQEQPKWHMVDVKLVRRLRRLVSLEELKRHKEGALASMVLFRQSRLSVQPVTQAEWDFILSLEDEGDGGDEEVK